MKKHKNKSLNTLMCQLKRYNFGAESLKPLMYQGIDGFWTFSK